MLNNFKKSRLNPNDKLVSKRNNNDLILSQTNNGKSNIQYYFNNKILLEGEQLDYEKK